MSNYTRSRLQSLICNYLQHSGKESYRRLAHTVCVNKYGYNHYELGDEDATGNMHIDVGSMGFTLSGFRDCCGIMVMSELFGVTRASPNKVKLLNFIINKLAYDVEVGAILYSATRNQVGTIGVIKALGFRKGSTFTNPRTDNEISMFMKKVNQ